MAPPELRLATPADGADCGEIYAAYVDGTPISFELIPPTAEEMARRIDATFPGYPWLVASDGGELIGYAYAHPFAARAAYQWAAETSIYVRLDARARGVGRSLYSALLEILRAQGFVRAFGGVTLPNDASVRLHESLGFRRVGIYEGVGWKLGRWHDVGWWECDLRAGVGAGEPGGLLTVDEVDGNAMEAALAPHLSSTPGRSGRG